MLLLYAALVGIIGFFVASFAFMVFASWYLGDIKKSMAQRFGISVFASTLVCSAVWFTFVFLLKVPTPEGWLF